VMTSSVNRYERSIARARSYVCDACVHMTHPSKVRDALDFDYSVVREQRIGS
jgi:hypothetical protein